MSVNPSYLVGKHGPSDHASRGGAVAGTHAMLDVLLRGCWLQGGTRCGQDEQCIPLNKNVTDIFNEKVIYAARQRRT
jgi:hypothetical protein